MEDFCIAKRNKFYFLYYTDRSCNLDYLNCMHANSSCNSVLVLC